MCGIITYMPPNLPPILPIRTTEPSLHGTGPTLHAQDLSVLKLQQKRDIEDAKVSANQVVTGSGYSRPTTSVNHIGGVNNGATTSINRPADQQGAAEEGGAYDEGADDRRYDYMQRLIRQRKAKESAREPIKSGEEGTFKVGIGKTYRTTGRMSFDRRLSKLMRQKRATYKNISKEDKKVFSGIVKGTLKGKPVGSEVSRLNRLKMKMKIERARTSRGGTLSSEDVKDFKGLVEKLK